ncbi:MAG TPA: condensation domain-containing protein, partial [Thermoanaerobaculia bacterium]|nr:condensation domain-containing protein [Thermoanaerobaculia bacterium]
MSTADRIAELSPRKRALLLARLRETKQAAAREPVAGRTPGPALEPLPRPDGAAELAYPVSFSQLREWILDRFDPGTSAYNIPMWIDLAGRIEVPALAGAIADLGRRHDALRTRFRPPGAPDGGTVFLSQAGERYAGEPEQVVVPAVRLDLPVIDLAGLPPARREAAAGVLERGHARLGFDLAEAPLFRVALLRLGGAAHRLLLSIHHVVSDGWSMTVLFRDLGALYLARTGAAAAAPRLPALALRYGDYAAWQRRRLQGETLEKILGYWRGRLAGAEPVLELPTDRPRTADRSLRAGSLDYRVPDALAPAVRQAAREHEVSLFMLLLAAFDLLFHRLTGQTDLSIGTFIANRNRAEIADLVGFFVNTLVLRSDLGGDPTLAEVLARVRKTTLGAYDHQDLPFEKLLDALQPKRDPGRTPLFQVLCVLQNLPAPELATGGLTLRTRSAAGQRANFELSAYLFEGDGSGRMGGGPGIYG